MRLDKLTSGIQLGDGKPSHLLNQLRRTNATTDDSIVRNFWIKRLPPQVRAVIAGMLQAAPETTLDTLANTADAVLDTMNDPAAPSTSTVSNSTISAISASDDRVGKLEKRVDKQDAMLQKINDKLSQLLSNNRSRQRDRSQSRPNRNATPHRRANGQQTTPQRSVRDQQNYPTCWFHREYGTQARKCLTPCDFPTESKN